MSHWTLWRRYNATIPRMGELRMMVRVWTLAFWGRCRGRRTFQTAMPAVQSWLLRHTSGGGQHGCRTGNRVDRPVSTARAVVRGPDVRHVPARGDGVGPVPVAAGGHQPGADDRHAAVGAPGQALDD